MAEDERERLSAKLGVPVFALPAIAASIRAERYFGSASELARFLYFDATSLDCRSRFSSALTSRNKNPAKR